MQNHKLNDKLKSYLMLHTILLIYSFGGIFSKLAAGETFLSVRYICFYGVVVLNLFIYALLWQQILKKMSVTTAFSNKGITVIWGIIIGRIFFNEQITVNKVIGAVFVIVGIIIVVTDDE